MGIFDFLKKKKPVESDAEMKSISFEEIEKWLEEKGDALREDEKEILGKIVEKLEEFYGVVEGKLGVLEGIDIESKKEHGRVKLLVRQGLDKYADSVHVFLKDLRMIKTDDLEKFTREVSEIFSLFEKRSSRFYDRATYLIGDEMVAVRNEIRRFYNNLVGIFNENKSLIDSLKKLGVLRLKLKGYGDIKNNLDEIKKEITTNLQGVEKSKKKLDKLKSDIEKIKNGSAYALYLKIGEEIKVLRTEIDNEVIKLKELIDFKKLTNIVHTNQKELGIVKDYKDHFASEFFRDGGKRILRLLEGSNMKSAEIEAQLSLIKKKNSELNEKSENVGLDPTVGELKEIKDIEEEIENDEIEDIKNKRRLEEISLKLGGLRKDIVWLVDGFGVEVV